MLARSNPANRRRAVVILTTGTAATAFAVAMTAAGWRGGQHQPAAYAVVTAIGVSFLAAGLVAWWTRPCNRGGMLMVIVGALWYANDLQATGVGLLYALGYVLAYLPAVVVGHAALAYPDGHLERPAEHIWVAVAYGSYLTLQSVRYLAEGAVHPAGGLPASVATSAWGDVISVDGFVLQAALLALVARRWRSASGPARRAHAPVWLAVIVLAGLVLANTVASAAELLRGVQVALVLAYGICLVGLPFAFLSGLLRVHLARQGVADLVLALERPVTPARLRELLTRTLGDRSLVLGFWSDAASGYVDEDGYRVVVSERGQERAATYVGGPGSRLAVLVHDPHLVEQRSLVESTVAAARLALENAHLEAILRQRVIELEASTARLAEAALEERRRIERDLHDGAQQRLLRLSLLAEHTRSADPVTGARQLLEQLAREARDAYAELRDLARGIHPPLLTERGLAAAVQEHVLRATLPVLVDLPAERWPGPVEATAFFAISEAVANAARHSGATRVVVRGRAKDGRLTVEVDDDGAGGADPGRGTGLRGLQDRVSALGGMLAVDSPAGQGTRIVVSLPCE